MLQHSIADPYGYDTYIVYPSDAPQNLNPLGRHGPPAHYNTLAYLEEGGLHNGYAEAATGLGVPPHLYPRSFDPSYFSHHGVIEDASWRVGLEEQETYLSLPLLLAGPIGVSPPERDADGWYFRVTKTKQLRDPSEFARFEDIVASVPPGTKWMDPDRPAVLRKHLGKAHWVVPSQLFGNRAAFVIPGRHARHAELLAFDLSDVQQGAVGDCYLFGGLSVVLQHPELFHRCLGRVDPHRGIYEFIFYDSSLGYQEGAANEVRVCVDEHIAVHKTASGWKHLYVMSDDHGEFWPQLLEKAYAKVFGSYEELNKPGWCGESIGHICNGAGGIYQDWCNTTVFGNTREVERKLRKLLNAGCLLAAGFRKMGNQVVGQSGEMSGNNGLAAKHAYGVLELFNVTPTLALVKLRNPWAKDRGAWKGAWGDGAAEWVKNPGVAEAVGYQQGELGVFFMEAGDFARELQGLMFAKVVGVENRLVPVERRVNYGGLLGGGAQGAAATHGRPGLLPWTSRKRKSWMWVIVALIAAGILAALIILLIFALT